MFRIRLASVALALGLLYTVSGCSSCREPLFPRVSGLFNRSQETPCDCQGAGQLPPEFAAPMPAPMLGQGGHSMPTITTVPTNSQPPQILKTPATTTPYFPPVN